MPPPVRPEGRGVWVNLCAAERAAGVAVFSGGIQVSVNARKSRDFSMARAEILSGWPSFTAEWQFQRPPLTMM